jgi:hypothetical protein
MSYEPQDFYQARQVVLTANKQTTYGTAVASANLLHKLRFDGGAFARISKEYRTDLERAGKGHPWATERQVIQQTTGFQLSGELTDYLAGWLSVFMHSKVTTTGAGPYTHTSIFENTTNIAPATTIYFQDTADIKYVMPDLSMSELQISGSEKGPISFSCTLMGSGRYTDGAVAGADALAMPTNVLSAWVGYGHLDWSGGCCRNYQGASPWMDGEDQPRAEASLCSRWRTVREL